MTLLGLRDGERADYSEVASRLCDVSVSVKKDLAELYRRIVLYLLINNTDDHLRNLGLLRSGSGWRLSPAFDINPNPDATALRVTSVFAETEKEAALAALAENAHVFGLISHEADKILSEVSTAVKSCDSYAERAGIAKEERVTVLRAIRR